MTTNNQILLRPKSAADYIGLATSTLAKQRLRGDGPKFIRMSARAIGYLQADLDTWLTDKRCSSTSDYGSTAANAPVK
jgi:predicted DNA-binding transcriptional regulator AlpA